MGQVDWVEFTVADLGEGSGLLKGEIKESPKQPNHHCDIVIEVYNFKVKWTSYMKSWVP